MSAPEPPRPHVVALRVAQALLDQLIVFVPLLVAAVLVIRLGRPHGLLPLLAFLKVVAWSVLGLALLGLWTLQIWWPHKHGGQTPAMRLLGLRVVTVEGGQPTLWAFLGRTVLMVIDGFAWGLVGVVIMLCTPLRQRFGDVVVRTMVVRVPSGERRDESADEAAFPGPDGDLGAVARP